MNEESTLTPIRRWRTRMHLLATALRQRMTVGVRAVLVDGRRVLLVRHTYLPGWQFPGGGVEVGETPEAAAAREALEETGHAPIGRPELLGFYLHHLAGTSRDSVAVYVWRGFEVRRIFRPNFEIAECRWFEIGALPEDLGAGTARRLGELFDGVLAASEW